MMGKTFNEYEIDTIIDGYNRNIPAHIISSKLKRPRTSIYTTYYTLSDGGGLGVTNRRSKCDDASFIDVNSGHTNIEYKEKKTVDECINNYSMVTGRECSWDRSYIERMIKFYLVDNLSLDEMCDIFHESYSTIKLHLKLLGLTKNKSKSAIDRNSREDFKKNHIEKLRKTMLEKWSNDEEYRKKCSEGNSRAKKEAWKDPVYARKMMFAWNSGKSMAEVFIQRVLEDFYPGRFEYVGNGKFSICGKIPDFIDCKTKIVILVNGCYWHACKECGFDDITLPNGKSSKDVWIDDLSCCKTYSEHGYKPIIIWEHEFGNVKEIISKINMLGEASRY